MEPFNILIHHGEARMPITIVPAQGIYQVIDQGKFLAALKPLGMDWELLPIEDIIEEIPLFETDLGSENMESLKLNTLTINQITAEIDNHLNHLS